MDLKQRAPHREPPLAPASAAAGCRAFSCVFACSSVSFSCFAFSFTSVVSYVQELKCICWGVWRPFQDRQRSLSLCESHESFQLPFPSPFKMMQFAVRKEAFLFRVYVVGFDIVPRRIARHRVLFIDFCSVGKGLSPFSFAGGGQHLEHGFGGHAFHPLSHVSPRAGRSKEFGHPAPPFCLVEVPQRAFSARRHDHCRTKAAATAARQAAREFAVAELCGG
mmetsp:Transcript_26714/g.54692  ORF Transcript_26714/g.54692 Transcript_26714/m.54692 type:complete len:221 (-) Transcript_26714:1072-1734(-)